MEISRVPARESVHGPTRFATSHAPTCCHRPPLQQHGTIKDHLKMKITYTSYTAVADWKWDLPEDADDTCGICRVQFEGTCAKCRYPGEECPIGACSPLSYRIHCKSQLANAVTVIGQCTHCFHMHCIGDWLNQEGSKGKCPMCRQDFTERKADAATPQAARTPEGQQQQQTPGTGAQGAG